MKKSHTISHRAVQCLPPGFLLSASFFFAAVTVSADGNNAPHAVTLADIHSRKAWTSPLISNDGHWVAYIVSSQQEDSELVVHSLENDRELRFAMGKSDNARGANRVAFSGDSEWLAFVVNPARRPGNAAKQQKSSGADLALVKLADGSRMNFPNVQDFSFSGEHSSSLAIHHAPAKPEAKDKSQQNGRSGNLLLHDLGTGTDVTIPGVSAYSFDPTGRWLALTIDSPNKTDNAIELRNMDSGALTEIDKAPVSYERLTWTKSGDGLALLKTSEDPSFENPSYSILAAKGFLSGSLKTMTYSPSNDSDFPAGMAISGNRNPEWTTGLDAVVFGISENHKKSVLPRSASNEDTLAAAEPRDSDAKPDLLIWNWQDTMLQTQERRKEAEELRSSYLAVYHWDAQKLVRVNDATLLNVLAPLRGKYAVAADERPYAYQGGLNGRLFADFYAVNLDTGERHLVARKISRGLDFNQQISRMIQSPDGSRFLYFENKNYYSCELASARCSNITARVPTSFVDELDDHSIPDTPHAPLGWTSDSRAVLLSEGYDIWRVSVTGEPAVNLTGNGRKNQIHYRQIFSLDPSRDIRADGIDLSQTLFVETLEQRTKKGGIAQVNSDSPGAHPLLSDTAIFSSLVKARNASTFLYTRETHTEAPELYAAGATLAGGRSLTNQAAEFRNVAMSPGARLVTYVSAKGEKLQAALYLPANYEPGKSYPTVVHIYERLSQELNHYVVPLASGDGFNEALYTSHGYAVLEPDIKYRVDDPGMSAVWCVLPAVKAAIATGIVDPRHVGLAGHSFGGYESAFLSTQTDIFAAISVGSPLTDLVSAYGEIYKQKGFAMSAIFESSQMRFSGPPWENLDAYIRNSPVFHAKSVRTPILLMHNDLDGNCEYMQGIEYYNTLRRMGKPIVLLEYPSEPHNLNKPANQQDYTARMLAFFNHFLKGAPAPEWWARGVSHSEIQRQIQEGTVEKHATGEDADASAFINNN